MKKDIKIKKEHWQILWNIRFMNNLRSLDEALCKILTFYEKHNKLKGHKDE